MRWSFKAAHEAEAGVLHELEGVGPALVVEPALTNGHIEQKATLHQYPYGLSSLKGGNIEAFIQEVALDKKRRLALGRIIGDKQIASFEIYETEGGYFLKPKVSIPADEAWIFRNPEAKKRLSRGLKQEAKHDLGFFGKYAK